MTQPLLTLRGITKHYPGVLANDGIDLDVLSGQAHAVLGENGAGKSTLMKIIYGSVKPDAGQVFFKGQPVSIRSPLQARQLGISMVFQHFSLFDTLSVAENIWLGLEPGSGLAELSERIRIKAAQYGLDLDPERPVHSLSVGEMQRVEIVRALLSEPQLLILDEPTSVLTPQAVEQLFEVLHRLVEQGCSILYISHKLHEIRALCSACTVLRAGRVTGVCDPRQETQATLSRMMIGSEPPALSRSAATSGDVVLQVRDLSLPRDDPFGTDLQHIDLQVRAGEVVGIAGVSGNGQRELFAALSGEDPRSDLQSIMLCGEAVGRRDPAQRRALGLHAVPEERLGRGAVPGLSLADNLLLTRTETLGPAGLIRPRALADQAQTIIERFQVKAAGPQAPARSLSGGNLQKFIVGREMGAAPRVLLVAQPTWGVDVGAAAQIRAELLALSAAGCAVLVISEELDELFQISDRLHVIAQGRLSPSLDHAQATPALVGQWMSGLFSAGGEHAQA